MLCPLCEFQNPDSCVRCRACGAKLGARETAIQNDSPDALPVGTVLGRLYNVEGVLGQGGFGITYRCRDQMLERAVAVKEFFPSGSRRANADVEPGRGFSSDDFREARAQFLLEARLLARCHHPGVVMVHTAFEENGTAYMVMELLHGHNLMQAMDARAGQKWSEPEALAPIERVGEALQYVHDQGLLHRDIKPENIVLCDDGRVMLLDFGTAREYVQGQSQGHTVTVTPGFAPLEQYAKQAKRGAFTDVYGLAATLYYLLTGAPPPAASDRAMGVLVRPVHEQNPRVSAGVASAVEAGLHMEIARRPQSVRAFLGLLHAPASEASKSETPALVAPILTETESHATLQSEIGASFSSQGFPTSTTPLSPAPFAPVALRPREPDVTKPSVLQPPSASLPSQSIWTSAPATSHKPNWSPSNSSGGIGIKDPDSNNWSGAMFGLFICIGIPFILFITFLIANSSKPPSPQTSGDWPNGSSLPNNSPNFNPPPGFGGFGSSSPSVAPTTMATETLWGIAPSSVQKLPVSAGAKSGNAAPDFGWAGFSPDGKWVAYRDSKQMVRVWDQQTRRVVRTMLPKEESQSTEITFSDSGKFLALSYEGNAPGVFLINVWNIQTGKLLGALNPDPVKDRYSVSAVRPDGQVLLRLTPYWEGSHADTSMLWWNPRTGTKKSVLIQRGGGADDSVFLPKTQTIVTGNERGLISWFDANTGKLKTQNSTTLTLRDHQASPTYKGTGSWEGTKPDDPLPVWRLRTSANGSFVASQNAGEIRVFDQNSQETGKITASYLQMFAVSPDGRSVASSTSNAGAQLLTVGDNQQTRLIIPEPDGKFVGALSFSPDGKQVQGVVSSPAGVSLYTWIIDGQSQIIPSVAASSSANPSPVTYSPSATTSLDIYPNAMVAMSDKVVASSAGNFADIRRTDGSLFKQFDINPGTATTAPLFSSEFALSPDGQLLGVRNATGKTQVWKVESEKAPISFAALAPTSSDGNFPNQNKHIVFSPDNRLAALVGEKGKKQFVELWDLQKAPRRLALVEQEAPVSALAFSPNGHTLVVGHQGGALQGIDIKTRKVVARSYAESPRTSVLAIHGSTKGWTVAQKTGEALLVVFYGATKNSPGNPNPFKVPSFTPPLFLQGNIGNVAVFSPDGRLLAVPMTGTDGNSVGLCDVATRSFLGSLPVSGTQSDDWLRTASVAFSPDGNRLSCLHPNQETSRTQITTWEWSPSSGTGN